MSIHYTGKIDEADLGELEIEATTKRRGKVMTEEQLLMRGFTIEDLQSQESEDRGFIVSLSGYTPYKNPLELMDPVGIRADRSNWGVVTRLMHLKEIQDGGSPFELYQKTDVTHFKLETGEVVFEGSEQPLGIGVNKEDIKKKFSYTLQGEDKLIDPMTNETISRVAKLDEYGQNKTDRTGKVIYEVNDHWFKLNFKLYWKVEPQATEEPDEAGK